MGVASSSGLLTSVVDAGNLLRFVGSRWDPQIPWNWGVAIAQQPISIAPYFNPSRYVTVFKYAVTIGRSNEERAMVASLTQAHDILLTRFALVIQLPCRR